MTETSTLYRPSDTSDAPTGSAPLRARKRYLRRRSQRRRLGGRGLAALWVVAGALVSWIFIVGFASLGH